MAYASISIVVEGTTYRAEYELKAGTITVRSEFGTKSAPLGNSPPDAVARMLLRELLEMEKLRRDGLT